jgi:uncharacterized protein (DUF1501 family)
MAENPLLHLLGIQSMQNGRVLVLIQLNGGNDGLNTVIALDRYSELTNARSNILIPQNRVLTLNNSTGAGLNPAMTEMQTMYNNGLMNIVQGVSYPNPNFSHFRASDIWLTAAASNQYLNTGWLGRAMDQQFVGYPDSYPNATMPDPLAVQIGSQASYMTQTGAGNAAVTVTNPNSFYNLVNGTSDPAPDTPYGHELTFLRMLKQQTNAYTAGIAAAYNSNTTLATYPTSNSLGDQLKIVARLIKGGLKTPIYIVNHPNSFDTHSNQTDAVDTTIGTHANLLGALSKAINAFQQDLTLKGVDDRVVGMTFTEFGRRIKSNASGGTDHGTSIPMFFFGKKVNPALTGASPVLPANATVNDQIPMQFDFRAVYYTILKDWFELSDTDLSAVLFQTYTTLPIFQQTPLPVTLLGFKGSWKDGKVGLQWQVDQEINISRYDIERSKDGANFEKIGSVSATNATTRHDYTYSDENLLLSLYYYRLKISDRDGTFKHSGIVMLKKNQQPGGIKIKVMPNPVRQWFNVGFEEKISGHIITRLIDFNGKEVWRDEKQVTDVDTVNFRLTNKTITPGVYVVHITARGEETFTRVMIEN